MSTVSSSLCVSWRNKRRVSSSKRRLRLEAEHEVVGDGEFLGRHSSLVMASGCRDLSAEAAGFEPSQYQTTMEQEVVSTSSLPYYSARIEHMMERRSRFEDEVEFQIEASRDHWSETVVVGEAEVGSNRQVFEGLKEQWGTFFWDYGDRLVVGKKIAEGGQAEIFEADVQLVASAEKERLVAKVMKEPCSLLNLQLQLPLGLLHKIQAGCPFFLDTDSCCLIWGATLLDDDRFAYLMPRYWGDLRKLIDLRMRNQLRPPFRDESARLIMLQIADAMEGLHRHDILHRDLKASNVLVNLDDDDDGAETDELIQCVVADFECSVGVVGTGYWRAPEVLAALKAGNPDRRVYTKHADVYSYAMTCYEILTGGIPFEDRPRTDCRFVLAGQRPQLPDCVRPELKALMCRCWAADPSQRPAFAEIVKILDKMYTPASDNELDELPNFHLDEDDEC